MSGLHTTINARARGRNPYDGESVTLEAMLDDFRPIAEALGPIDLLVGASLGGALALAAGRRYPVGGVVTADPFFHSQAGDWGSGQLAEIHALQSMSQADLTARIRRSTPWNDSLDIEARVRAIETLSATWVERFLLDNRVDEAGWDLRAELDRYPRPLLIVIAGVGSLIPVEDRRRLRELGGPNLSSHTLEGHGHSLHRSGLEPFAELTASFLKEGVLGRRSPSQPE